MNNALMKKFEQNLYYLINNSNLTVGEAYYILKCALLELEKIYEDCIQDDLNGTTQETTSETMDLPVPEDQNIDLTGGFTDGDKIVIS